MLRPCIPTNTWCLEVRLLHFTWLVWRLQRSVPMDRWIFACLPTHSAPPIDSPSLTIWQLAIATSKGRSQKRTLANLSKLPRDVIDTLKAVLKGGTVIGTGLQELEVERSLPHGHVAAALGMIRKIGLDRLILGTAKDPASRRCCNLVVAIMVDRLIAPRSKLGFVRAVDEETASSSLGTVLRLGRVKEREAL